MALTRLGLNQSVNLASNVTGTLATGNGGTGATSFSPGKILQVVENHSTTSQSTTSATFVTTGFSATLTPASTSNKIYIMLNGGRTSYNDAGVNPNRLSVTFYSSIGGATAADIMGSSAASNFDLITSGPGYTWGHAYSMLYSPSTTSSVAITPYYRAVNDDGTPFFNHYTQSINVRVTLTIMEIAA
jgi:hypothetical protein|tara:strand:+ start:1313 stop:1873 length:561 start_codon:yes stop_codon:yes gene_type:complete